MASTPVFVSSAQSPDSIPRDLVLGLVGAGNFPGRDPLRVGTIPNYVPDELIPPGALILGSLSLPGRTTIVLRIPPTASDPEGLVRGHLRSTGWTTPERSTPNFRLRGFVTSSLSLSPSSPALCRNGAQIILLGGGRSETEGATVTMHWTPEGSMGLCNLPPSPRGGARFDDAPVPALFPPEGMGMEMGGSSSTSNGTTFSARLTGNIPPDSVRQHYAAQLIASGWTPDPATGTPSTALQTFTHDGGNGSTGPWHALLAVVTFGRGTTLDALLLVRASVR